VQDVDSAAADELAADAVPWIAPRFVEGHRNVALSQGIDAAQVAARADGLGIVGWQFVEQLGLETTFHHRSIG
jgi:hypothetical protein